ncbi:transposase [Paenibacillus thiaminolyticus]|uniref:transposase n=1 Tax=Paenibacillus thiaminolyticus TaxID=49283 RepID=UPI0035A5FD76
MAKIGDASQLSHSKQIVAKAGLDPGVFSSGKFTASENKMTKAWFQAAEKSCLFSGNVWIVRIKIRFKITSHREYDKKKAKESPIK